MTVTLRQRPPSIDEARGLVSVNASGTSYYSDHIITRIQIGTIINFKLANNKITVFTLNTVLLILYCILMLYRL